MEIRFSSGPLTAAEQALVLDGFREHSAEQSAPDYDKERVKWLGIDDRNEIKGVLTADILWDWMYLDELWVCSSTRGTGLGKKLVLLAEDLARDRGLRGVWLWTQSWQAVDFYKHLGFEEFARFDDFPRGHTRVGFRKEFTPSPQPAR